MSPAEKGDAEVLVIGAGVAGMEASLLLSRSGRKVRLVEKASFTGGASVLFEQVYPDLECATCMLSPRQQDLLQDPNIHLMTLSEVTEAHPSPEGFAVKVRTRPRYIVPEACIGCGACYEPCPVSRPNEAEEGLSLRKAVYVPFAGALPNVPMIDSELCLRLKGEDCQKCKEACVFEAVDFSQKEQETELRVQAIVLATGSEPMDLRPLPRYGYGRIREVYTAMEMERLFSSNGPTSGRIVMRNGEPPRSVALVHCAGREEAGYCSAVCCMYLLKFNHYLRAKMPDVEVHEYYTDMTIPGQSAQKFYTRMMEGGTDLVRARDLRLEEKGDGVSVLFKDALGNERERTVDMAVLAPALRPRPDAERLYRALGISPDDLGFVSQPGRSPVGTSRPGIYVIGCAQGPKGIGAAVSDAFAAVSMILGAQESGADG